MDIWSQNLEKKSVLFKCKLEQFTFPEYSTSNKSWGLEDFCFLNPSYLRLIFFYLLREPKKVCYCKSVAHDKLLS